jgi:sigma-B regulation protein RsbU (phosphoserine phosphatase)
MPEAKDSKLLEKLQLKDFKLSSLLEVTSAINENYSIQKLLSLYEYILREQLGISRLALFNRDETWQCLIKFGVKGVEKKINVEKDLYHIKDITVIESSSVSALDNFDIVIPIFHKSQPLAYLLIGDLEEDSIQISPTVKHMPFIQTLTNIIMVAIENKRFAKNAIEQERTKKELELAAVMQAMLYPKNLPSNNRIDASGLYESQRLVGGDYYDFVQLNNEEYFFCIADVSGKGMSAALLMSNFQANVQALLRFHQQLTLSEFVKDLNETVMKTAQGEKFVTFFVGYYHCTKRILKYINAGHNPPVLTNGKTARLLDKGCIGLGMLKEIPAIEEELVTVEPNSIIVCYTDGLVEMENEAGDPFEIDRLTNLIHENYTLSMDELNNLILNKLKEHKGDLPFLDDTALLSCRFL